MDALSQLSYTPLENWLRNTYNYLAILPLRTLVHIQSWLRCTRGRKLAYRIMDTGFFNMGEFVGRTEASAEEIYIFAALVVDLVFAPSGLASRLGAEFRDGLSYLPRIVQEAYTNQGLISAIGLARACTSPRTRLDKPKPIPIRFAEGREQNEPPNRPIFRTEEVACGIRYN